MSAPRPAPTSIPVMRGGREQNTGPEWLAYSVLLLGTIIVCGLIYATVFFSPCTYRKKVTLGHDNGTEIVDFVCTERMPSAWERWTR